MAAIAAIENCETCAYRCPEVCEAEPACAFRAARTQTRQQGTDTEANIARHHRYLVAAICRMTGRFDIARDLAQDVFVKALTNIDAFRQHAQFTTWLYAIARNRCYDFLKSRAALREVGEEALAEAAPVVDNAALRALEVSEARRIVVRLIRDAVLEPVERRAFMLHYAGGVSLDELTRGLHLHNRSGAKAQIVSARRKLGRAATRWKRRESVKPR
jgi:RNA polymerase sigma-70 factor (ECF subfamily)